MILCPGGDKKMNTTNEYLFVYGTLLKTANHAMTDYLNRNSTYQGRGYIHGKLYEVMRYPGVVASTSPDEKVFGEVYLLEKPQQVLRDLDHYEECVPGFPEPFEYIRKKVPVFLDESRGELEGWVYLYNHPVEKLTQIPSGDYIEYLKSL